MRQGQKLTIKENKSYFLCRTVHYNKLNHSLRLPQACKPCGAEVSNPNGFINNTNQTIIYNYAHNPTEIKEGNNKYGFEYGIGENRRRMEKYAGEELDQLIQFKHYGNNIEIDFDVDNGDELFKRQVCYVGGGDGLAAVVVYEGEQDPQVYASYTDYLGSIELLTDEGSSTIPPAVIAEQSFDPWGKFRDPAKWIHELSYDPSLPDWLSRGYTGHEHIEAFQLINMNGRLYDPYIGRMLSPDNYVQNSSSTQNFNRYSYVLNNPLKYTDPSGEVLEEFFGSMFKSKRIPQPSKSNYAQGDALLNTYAQNAATVQTVMFTIATGGLYAGLPFANTLAIVSGSSWGSFVGYSYTGGQSDIVVSFGAGSYNFSQGEFGYLFKQGNNTMENIGYVLGALANVSDVVNYTDGLKMTRQQNQTPERQREIFDKKFKLSKKDKYISANGKGNPIIALDVHGDPTTPVGWKAFNHDVFYYENGADGALSFLFNTNVLQADKTLLQAAMKLSGTKYAGQVKFFTGFVFGLKSIIPYSSYSHFLLTH